MKRSSLVAVALPLFLLACTEGDTVSTRTPKGNPQATILVEEFADFQCPACKAAHTQINTALLEQFGSQIRFEFKHFPLRSLHRYALDAAELSECMADQGKFWEYVDLAFQNQENMTADALLEWVTQAGGDADAADTCFRSHRKRGLVLADYETGRERGVAGTPTYFVNGKQIQTGFDTLSEAITAELSGPSMPL